MLAWFAEQVGVSTGQPGPSHLSVLLAAGPAQLPPGLTASGRPLEHPWAA